MSLDKELLDITNDIDTTSRTDSDSIILIVKDNPFSADYKLYQIERKTYRAMFEEFTRGVYPISYVTFFDSGKKVHPNDYDKIPSTDHVVVTIQPAGDSGLAPGSTSSEKSGAFHGLGFALGAGASAIMLAGSVLMSPVLVLGGLGVFGLGLLSGVAGTAFMGSALLSGDSPANPRGEDSGSRRNSLRGSQNRLNAKGIVNIVLGKHLVYPDVAGQSYLIYVESKDQTRLRTLYVVGYDNVHVVPESLKIGELSADDPELADAVDYQIQEGSDTGKNVHYVNASIPVFPNQIIKNYDRDGVAKNRKYRGSTPTGIQRIYLGFSIPLGIKTEKTNVDKSLTANHLFYISLAPIEDPSDVSYVYPEGSYPDVLGETRSHDIVLPYSEFTSSDFIRFSEFPQTTWIFNGKTNNAAEAQIRINFTDSWCDGFRNRIASNGYSGQLIIEIEGHKNHSDTYRKAADGEDSPGVSVVRDVYLSFITYTVGYTDALGYDDPWAFMEADEPIRTPTRDTLTRIGMTIWNEDNLNKLTNKISCVARLSTRDYSGSGSGLSAWNTNVYTSNPASMFLYVLTDPKINRDYEKNLDRIDWPYLEEWWEFCNNGGNYGNNGNPLECNLVINDEVTVDELLSMICVTGYAAWSMIDGKIRPIFDSSKKYITQYFTPKNTFDFSGSRMFEEHNDAVIATFVNSGGDVVSGAIYEEDTLTIHADPDNPTEENPLEVQAVGMTNPRQVQEFARYILATQRFRSEQFTFSTDIENIVCVKGDRIQLSHDIALIGVGIACRVVDALVDGSGNVTQIEVDEYIEFEDGVEYGIVLRPDNPNDTTNATSSEDNIIRLNIETDTSNNAVIESDGSERYYFVLSSTIAADKIKRDMLCMPGKRGEETLDLLVEEINYAGDMQAEILAVPYAPEIFDIGDTIPDYVPNVTSPSESFSSAPTTLFDPAEQLNRLTKYTEENANTPSNREIIEGTGENGPITTPPDPNVSFASSNRTVIVAIGKPGGYISGNLFHEIMVTDSSGKSNDRWYSPADGDDPPKPGWETSWQGLEDVPKAFNSFDFTHNRVPFAGTPDIPVNKVYYYRVRAGLTRVVYEEEDPESEDDPSSSVVTTYSEWVEEYIEIRASASIDLAQGSITAEKIVANAVTAEKIKAGAVTAEKINVTDLFSQNITVNNGGSIQSENYTVGVEGFLISSDGFAEFREGTVGGIVIESDYLKSSNYTQGMTGFKLNTDGSAEFREGTIGGIEIGDTYLRSDNYIEDEAGFKLNTDGSAEFREGTIGGIEIGSDFIKSSGYQSGISGFILNTSGDVEILQGVIGGINIGATHLRSSNYTQGETGFELSTDGSAEFREGIVGGWHIGVDYLRSRENGARIELNKEKNRVSIFDTVNEKIAMGYLDGLPKFDGTGSWTGSDYGFWARPGDRLRFDGDMTYENGSFLLQSDSSLIIYGNESEALIEEMIGGGSFDSTESSMVGGGSVTTIEDEMVGGAKYTTDIVMRMGTYSGRKGFFINETITAGEGLRAEFSAEEVFVGNDSGAIYWDTDARLLRIDGGVIIDGSIDASKITIGSVKDIDGDAVIDSELDAVETKADATQSTVTSIETSLGDYTITPNGVTILSTVDVDGTDVAYLNTDIIEAQAIKATMIDVEDLFAENIVVQTGGSIQSQAEDTFENPMWIIDSTGSAVFRDITVTDGDNNTVIDGGVIQTDVLFADDIVLPNSGTISSGFDIATGEPSTGGGGFWLGGTTAPNYNVWIGDTTDFVRYSIDSEQLEIQSTRVSIKTDGALIFEGDTYWFSNSEVSRGTSAIAFGDDASAFGDASIAIGKNASNEDPSGGFGGDNIIAIGVSASVGYADTIGIGKDVSTYAQRSVAIGNSITTQDNNDGVVIGNQAQSYQVRSIVIGFGAGAYNSNSTESVVIGYEAYSNSSEAVVIGKGANAPDENAYQIIAVGNGAVVSTNHGVALGISANVSGSRGIALGTSASTSAERSTVLGTSSGANASATHAAVLGDSNSVTGEGAIKIGSGYGYLQKDVLSHSIAIGRMARCETAENSVIIGSRYSGTFAPESVTDAKQVNINNMFGAITLTSNQTEEDVVDFFSKYASYLSSLVGFYTQGTKSGRCTIERPSSDEIVITKYEDGTGSPSSTTYTRNSNSFSGGSTTIFFVADPAIP